jgi:uroporphyrinogen decarboxylase
MDRVGGICKDRMSPQERMGALMMGQTPDRVPFNPFAMGFAAINAGYKIRDMYDNAQKAMEAQLWTAEQYGYEPIVLFGYAAYGGWEFGGDVKMPTSPWEGAPAVARHPIESDEDLEKLELPDVKTAGILPASMEFSKLCDQMGLPILPGASGDVVTVAGNVADVSRFCRWMMKKPELAHRMLRLSLDHLLEVYQYWVDTFGAQKIMAGFFVTIAANQIMSPKQFEKFVLPYQYEFQEKVLAMGVQAAFFHICGEQNLNLPLIQQLPLGSPRQPVILSFGHEVDLDTAIKMFPNNIIAGNVEPQVIQNGSPRQVYELTRIAIEKGKKAPGGFFLMPGCELPPMAPGYNVYTMMKAVNDFGFYS